MLVDLLTTKGENIIKILIFSLCNDKHSMLACTSTVTAVGVNRANVINVQEGRRNAPRFIPSFLSFQAVYFQDKRLYFIQYPSKKYKKKQYEDSSSQNEVKHLDYHVEIEFKCY